VHQCRCPRACLIGQLSLRTTKLAVELLDGRAVPRSVLIGEASARMSQALAEIIHRSLQRLQLLLAAHLSRLLALELRQQAPILVRHAHQQQVVLQQLLLSGGSCIRARAATGPARRARAGCCSVGARGRRGIFVGSSIVEWVQHACERKPTRRTMHRGLVHEVLFSARGERVVAAPLLAGIGLDGSLPLARDAIAENGELRERV